MIHWENYGEIKWEDGVCEVNTDPSFSFCKDTYRAYFNTF